MKATEREDLIVLEEFRLHDADGDGSTARIVAAASRGTGDPPLLTSIDDPRDVALLRTVPAGSPDADDPRYDAALGHLVAGWRRSKRYRSRIAAEVTHPSSYRLAVTESGINDEPIAPDAGWFGAPAAGETIAALLIGVPVGTHAGLLVLVGSDRAQPTERGPAVWPLPLSRDLGVRIYQS